MPAAAAAADDELIPGLHDGDDTRTAEPEPEFAFAATAPPSKKSRKKGKKGLANKGPSRREGEGDVTPSPPKDDGVRLAEDAGQEEHGEEMVVLENGVLHDVIDPEPAPAEVPPPPSVPTMSPRLAPARPASSRPASIHSPPPQQPSSLAGHRPQNAAVNPPFPSQPARRESATHVSPRPRLVEPVAPPHKVQPHFYGIPDWGLNFGQQKTESPGSGKAAGSEGYCCCLDSFADSGDAVSGKKAKDALLVGSEGGLEVFRVLPNKLEVVGRLEGLRGSVIGAKILPRVVMQDSLQKKRPLIAVIVHGAMIEEGKAEDVEDKPPAYYQTTVEVYSLREQSHVATLYRSIPVAVEKPAFGHLASLPGPVADLSLAAEGKYVVVASGKSGEVFVFSHVGTTENPHEQFRCLGKFWTSLQTSPATATAARPQSSSEGGPNGEEKDERAGVPVFSLSQRWLALMAPSMSAHVSIGGSPMLLESNPPPPGVASHVAPPQPSISCDIAGVDAEGTWTRLTRQAAQGLVKYSHIGFEMGRQGWRELTNPTPQSGGQHARTASRDHDAFPPTMAPFEDPHRIVKEPAIVSIIDLETLLGAEETKPKYAHLPLSTFALQEGCNYLSLSSSGLRLLSVSRSGKVSTIWDLTQCCHGVARPGLSPEESKELAQGPCVKQLHRFERNSESVVVGATWSRDDDMLAVLTSHGTVHLHEVPARPSRKRRRRNTSTATTASPPQAQYLNPEKAEATVGVSAGVSPPSTNNGWMGNFFKSGLQQVNNTTGITSFRPTMAGFREITASAGQAGGRALARGLSQGLTAAKGGAGDLWYADQNKIRFAELRRDGGSGGGGHVMRWVRRPSETLLAVVCAGTVHLYAVQRAERRRGEEIVSGLRRDKHGRKSFVLPLIKTAAETVGKTGRDECEKAGVHGFWSLPGAAATSEHAEHDARFAGGRVHGDVLANEVETNPPYCPFHVDPRVGIYAFNDAEEGQPFALRGQRVEDDEGSWVFGEGLPGSVKLNISTLDEDDDGGVLSLLAARGGETDDDDGEEEGLAAQMESQLTVREEGEVRVHTRPRRRRVEGNVEIYDEDGV